MPYPYWQYRIFGIFAENFAMKFILSFLFLFVSQATSAQSIADEYSTLYNKGIEAIGKKEYGEAKELFNQAIALKPDYAEAVFARGTCSLMLQEREEACTDFEQAGRLRWKPAFEYIGKYCQPDSYGRKTKPEKQKTSSVSDKR